MLNVETDLEQLEQYLDGAMEADALSGLQKRLGQDMELSRALAKLKAERAVRAAAWQSMEPDAGTADRLMWRVRGAVLQQKQQTRPAIVTPAATGVTRFWNQWRLASIGSAAAACLVLGFAFGRIGQGHNSGVKPSVNPTPARVDVASDNQPMLVPDEVQPAADRGAIATGAAPIGNAVPIVDEYGRVITVQKFKTPEEARHFAEDLHKTRPAGNPAPVIGPPKLAAEEPF
jgi:anti-sigma factor RsiW